VRLTRVPLGTCLRNHIVRSRKGSNSWALCCRTQVVFGALGRQRGQDAQVCARRKLPQALGAVA
jgi:hypothetical protein